MDLPRFPFPSSFAQPRRFRPVPRRARSGFTLIEMTVVIALLLGLSTLGFAGYQAWNNYSQGLAAGGILKEVAAAQKAYLADNPSQTYNDITLTALGPYMPGGTVPNPYNGYPLPLNCSINCSVYPPVAMRNGAIYDPSHSTKDGQWDIGPNQ